MELLLGITVLGVIIFFSYEAYLVSVKQFSDKMQCMICKHGDTADGFTTITSSLLKDANAIIARGAKVDIREFGLVA